MCSNNEKIIVFRGTTINDIPPEKILESVIASPEKLTQVIIIGTTEDGDPYYASSYGDKALMLWEIEKLKKYLLNRTEKGDETW